MHSHLQRLPRLRWPYVLALLAVLIFPAAPPKALAVTWPAPERVNLDQAQSGNEPSMDYDAQGFAHVVWFGGATNDAWAIYYTNNRSGTWAPQRLISTGGKSDERKPSIAVGNDGSVHVAWERRKDGSEIYYNVSRDLGVTWGRPVNVSNQDDPSYEPGIAVDSNGVPTIAWIDRRFSSENDVTLVSSLIGGRWTGPFKASSTDDRSPTVTTTGSGANVQVHVVWYGRPFGSQGSLPYDLLYVTGTPGGTYGAPRNISNDAGVWSLDPAIASDGASGLFLIWDKQADGKHQPHFMYSNNAGASWSEPRNLNPNTAEALFPDVDFGGGLAHLAWGDKSSKDSQQEVLYVAYDPASNSFSPAIDRVPKLASASDKPSVGAHPQSTSIGIAFQSRNGSGFLKSWVSRIGGGVVPTPVAGPTARIAADAGNTPSVNVSLTDVTGEPNQMRLAIDRAPTDNDPWENFQATFTREVAAAASCDRAVYVQLRNTTSGQTSPVLVGRFDLDTSVQAMVHMRNPSYSENLDDFSSPTVRDIATNGSGNGDPAYTRQPDFRLEVVDMGECNRLTSIRVEPFTNVISPTENNYVNVLPLPGPLSDGPRGVTVHLRDERSNERTFSDTITLDRTAPTFVSGTLAGPVVPSEGLPSALVSLSLSGVSVTDNLYPNGMWGVWVANTLTTTLDDNDPSLDWRPVAVPSPNGGTFSVRRWNVLLGLDRSITDSLAGQDIQVRVRFLDGAGNPTDEPSLRTTVRLAPNYDKPSVYLPLLSR